MRPSDLPAAGLQDIERLLHQLVDFQRLASIADGSQRIAQLMAQHGQKLIFLPIGASERFFDLPPVGHVHDHTDDAERATWRDCLVEQRSGSIYQPARFAVVGSNDPELLGEQTAIGRIQRGVDRRPNPAPIPGVNHLLDRPQRHRLVRGHARQRVDLWCPPQPIRYPVVAVSAKMRGLNRQSQPLLTGSQAVLHLLAGAQVYCE